MAELASTDPYALSNDTARVWKATGWARRRRMTPAECAMVGSGLWMIAACLFGDDLAVSQASHAAAKATHALLREKALLPAVSASTNAIPDDLRDAVEEHIRRNDPLGILGRRRLSRRPTRVRGRRTRAERRKR